MALFLDRPFLLIFYKKEDHCVLGLLINFMRDLKLRQLHGTKVQPALYSPCYVNMHREDRNSHVFLTPRAEHVPLDIHLYTTFKSPPSIDLYY